MKRTSLTTHPLRTPLLKSLPQSLLLAAVLSLPVLSSHAADAPAAAPAAASAPRVALTVSVVSPRSSELNIAIAANGSVFAWQEASIGSEANGLRVSGLHASVGDSVRKGQLLLNFAAESVLADLALAKAALAEAQANAAEATANADRARAIKDSGALSAQQIGQYTNAEATAKARVESARAQLDAQQLRLQHTQVFAPDDGIISARSATLGSVVGAGTELFKLIRQGRLEWRAEVTAAELARINASAAVQVTAPGGALAKGRVRSIAPTVDAQTRNGLVYVDLLAAKGFKPGMFARGEFSLGASTALTVPQSAVIVRDGFSYVFRLGAGNKVSQVKVVTGRTVGDQVELLSGVSAKDKVVASGGGFLSDGDLVKVVGSAQ